MTRMKFIYEVLKKYDGKYQMWKIKKIASLGEHLYVKFSDENALYIPMFKMEQSTIDNLPEIV